MHALGLEFVSAAQLSKRPGSVWNCLWGNALKRSPGIIRKSRVSYPGPGFLSSATWPMLPKKHYNGLNQTKPYCRSLTTPGKVRFADRIVMTIEETLRLGWGKDLLQATLDFVDRISDMVIDNTEFCMVNAIVLSYPGNYIMGHAYK